MHLQEIFKLELIEWGSHYNAAKSHRLLLARGWVESTVPREYDHPDAPGFSIDLDIHNIEGNGPFTVFRGGKKLAQVGYPPYAQHLMAGQYQQQHRAA